jgi:hypothetical protein
MNGCGSSSGLSVGARGTVSGTSHRALITRITGSNNCEAESSATAGQIASSSHVNF